MFLRKEKRIMRRFNWKALSGRATLEKLNDSESMKPKALSRPPYYLTNDYSPILLQLAREFESLYRDIHYRVEVVSELIRYMADFRFQVLGETAYQAFIQAVQVKPTQFLMPVHLRIAPKSRGKEGTLAWINPKTLDQGVIYLNLSTIEQATKGCSTKQIASFLESTLLHEWVHLLQFSIDSDRPLLLKELNEKKWTQRWYEQEAIYVTERVYRSLIHQKEYSKRGTHGLVRKIACCPNTPIPFCFKQMALEPYAKAQGFVA